MKLLTSYALSTGLKINDPFVVEHYYPLPFKKYITIHASSGMDSKNYSYWQDVVDFIKDQIEIPIVQIGEEKDTLLKGCFNLLGKTSLHQTFFVLKNSKLHLGNDSFPIHACGFFGVPVVALYGATTIANHGPFFKNGRQYLIESHRNKKNPSFASKEEEPSVDLIKVEEILQAIQQEFPQKNIPEIETLHIGDLYTAPIVEFIPNFKIDNIGNGTLNIRMDYFFNEHYLSEALKIHKSHIISDRKIDPKIIYAFKNNIRLISFNISNELIDADYLNSIINSGIRVQLIYDGNDEQELSKLRFKYFDFTVIHSPKKSKNDIDFLDKIGTMTFFKSKKIIFSERQPFLSKQHALNNQPIDNENNIMKLNKLDDDFVEELDFFFIFNQK